MHKILWWEYAVLLFVLPLLFYPLINYFPLPVIVAGFDLRTSELFELPKMFFVYAMTFVVMCTWGIGILKGMKATVKGTGVGYAYLIFFGAYVVTTFFSIDLYSSLFGYPTRLHGGLISYLSYAVLLGVYATSNFSLDLRQSHLKILLASGLVISIYAIAQRFGVDAQLWNEDVQSRVFSTFGQPNWLAAFLSALLPVGLYFGVNAKRSAWRVGYIGYLMLLGLAIVLTGSRAGMLGGGVALGGALVFVISKYLQEISRVKVGLVIASCSVVMMLASGFFWQYLTSRWDTVTIRTAVWEGAWNIFLAQPWLGSGPETFAFAFYENRPASILQTPEWGMLYNRAHNEPLHYLSTLGLLGFLAFVGYCATVCFEGWRSRRTENSEMQHYLFWSWFSLLIAHSMGFSVVVTGLLFFWIPMLMNQERQSVKVFLSERATALLQKLSYALGTGAIAVSVFAAMELVSIVRADLELARYRVSFARGNIGEAIMTIEEAYLRTPYNPWLLAERGWAYAAAIKTLSEKNSEDERLGEFEIMARASLEGARAMSPRNVLFAQREILTYAYLYKYRSEEYAEPLYNKMQTLETRLPNEIAIMEQFPRIYNEMGRKDEAIRLLEKFIETKPDYNKGREQLEVYLNEN